MSQFLVEKLISDPAHWDYQVSKVREFRDSLAESIAIGKANLRPRKEVVIKPLHEDSAPLRGLALASVMEKRGVLRGWGGNC